MNMTTSRIGRKPIEIPSGVEVKVKDNIITAKGPKGQHAEELHPYVRIELEGKELKIHPVDSKTQTITSSNKRLYRSIAGTLRAKLQNMIQGVSHGFEKKLTLVGVGYRAQAKGKVLSLSLGFSHPVEFPVPEGLTIETPSQTEIVIKGFDKQKVGLAAAKIRAIRSPEPYKGKGVRYANEVIEIKETKKK